MEKLTKEQLLQLQSTIGHLTGPNGRFTIKSDSRAYQTLHEFFLHCFQENKDKTFVVYEEERYTYGKAWEIIISLACQMRFHYNIERGDRVAVIAKNIPEWCFSFIAILLIGGVVVPLNGWWKEKELEYGFSDSGAKLVFCDIERFKKLEPCLEKFNINCILVANELPYPSTRISLFSSVVRQGSKSPKDIRILRNYSQNDDNALIMYTSGTTGNPKGVLLSHKSVLNQMEVAVFALYVQGEVARLSGHPIEDKYQPSTICATPLFHVTSSHHVFLTSVLRGGKLILISKWDAGRALRLIELERVTSWTGVPTMIQDLMEHPNFSKTDISSLQSIGSGGAPIAPSQVAKTRKSFNCEQNGSETRNGYGMTETGGAICFNTGVNMLLRPTSCGTPFPIVEVKVIDTDTKKELPRNVKGQLLVKTSLNMKEYWNNPKATKDNLEDGWLYTGDVAIVDDANFIHIVDREKDIVIRGGENISCTEVENEFFCHPSVIDCAVFGLPDERLGEVLGVVVQLKPGMKSTPQELVSFVKPNLAHYKVPEPINIFIWDKPLLKGATAKTHRRDIKAAVLADLKKSKL